MIFFRKHCPTVKIWLIFIFLALVTSVLKVVTFNHPFDNILLRVFVVKEGSH